MIHRVEARVWAAVFVAIAGCRPAAQPPNELPPDPSAEPSASSAPVAVAEDAAPAPSTSASASAQAVPMSVEGARGVCDAYKAKTDVKGRTPRMTPGVNDHWQPADSAVWAAATDTVHCSIVRDRIPTTFVREETPTCCRNGGSGRNQPCPPTTRRTVPGERIVLEQAEVRRDGSVVKSDLMAQIRDPNPYPRHNCGRRPEGFVTEPTATEAGLGVELATMATLEAASVPAFARLARELAHHGAPASLVRRAERARRDEIRHARRMTKLARAYGHAPSSFRAAAPTIRDPLAIARENAAEGCVAEAFGAVVATFQAQRADHRFRSTFEAVAGDERRHAALAEDVDAWIASRLSERERAEVRTARREAIAALRARIGETAGCPALGLPAAHEARALFEAYFDAA